MADYFIAPSLLAADFARLGEESQAVITAGGDWLHLDVMDNHFVPNLTVGPLVCASLRKYGISAPIDVHLMTNPVDSLIVDFAKAGASYITFHPECSENIEHSLALIHQHGCKAGLAFNPDKPLDALPALIDKIDLILMMSVFPGFGGQAFIPAVLEKVTQVRNLINTSGSAIRLSIDGGIKTNNIAEAASAGADTFVAGSAIFSQPNYASIIQAMRHELEKVT